MLVLTAPSATRETVMGNLPDTTMTVFRAAMFPALWEAAIHYGIDPVGMVAQSGKETAWGAFPGNVPVWFNNTAGIKVKHNDLVRHILAQDQNVPVDEISPDHPLVHQQNGSWLVGAVIQAQHLRAYCNAPFDDIIIDPRWDWVFGRHDVETWADLNGKWAGPTYGDEIETIMRRLQEA